MRTVIPGSTRTRRLILATGLGVAGALALSGSAGAGTRCVAVSGYYVEQDASGPDCTSPVGLCITGQYYGDIKGTFAGQATSIVPTADSPTTAVLLFTSNSVITGRIGGRTGSLDIRNAGAFRTAGEGSIVDLQTIIGGTGGLAGAGGDVRASGTFSTASGGRSDYSGTVCLP